MTRDRPAWTATWQARAEAAEAPRMRATTMPCPHRYRLRMSSHHARRPSAVHRSILSTFSAALARLIYSCMRCSDTPVQAPVPDQCHAPHVWGRAVHPSNVRLGWYVFASVSPQGLDIEVLTWRNTDRVFSHALNTVNKIRTGSQKPPSAIRLRLYGLYKQAMGTLRSKL